MAQSMNTIRFLFIFSLLGIILSCSSEKNTFTNRMYHNTTARYNAYFYAEENLRKIELAVAENHKEDYSQVLPVYYPIDSTTVEENEEVLNEIKDFASKAIEWHKISKWVDHSYYLLGMTDYYNANFDDASNTFRYLNVNSKKKNIRHKSLIHLMRQFTDLEKFDDAAYVVDFLSKESGISKENKFNLYKNLAYYYQARGDINGKIGALDKATDHTKDKEELSRIHFILAQLYQREGLDNLAYSYYKEAQKGNPPYEREFFSQLFAQQVSEINKSKDIKKVRNYYEDLYKDSKNIDLRDVILYERAIFELKQEEVEEAERLLLMAAKEEGQNPIQKGYIYQKLAEISLDIKKDFRATKYYLDSALANFRPQDKPYTEIEIQKSRFDNYVTHFENVSSSDSLIRLSQLSPEEQEIIAEAYIAREEERLIREAEAKQKATQSTTIFDNLLAFGGRGTGQSFYFDNAVAVQQGAIDFTRNWGNRPLEDNWRRNEQGFGSSSGGGSESLSQNRASAVQDAEEEVNILANIPDKATLLSQIPSNEAAVNELRSSLEASNFELGKLLYFDFKEMGMSKNYLESLITTFPNTNKKAEAYYILYLNEKDAGGNYQAYADRLKKDFPESPYTYSVNNPDGIKGNQAFLESSKEYKEAYNLYSERQFAESRRKVRNTLEAYPLTKNTERLLLLDIMISGKIDNTERYQSRLENYIQTTENEDLLNMARNMLKALTGEKTLASAEVPEEEADQDQDVELDESSESETEEVESPYKENPNQTHIFVIALEPEKAKEAKSLLAELEGFHTEFFSNARLRTGNMNMSREEAIFIVSPFNNAERALAYREKFMNDFNSSALDDSDKERSFLISIQNFQELNKRKDLNEYRQFYKKAYN